MMTYPPAPWRMHGSLWLTVLKVRADVDGRHPAGTYGVALVDYQEPSPLTYGELLVAVRDGEERVRFLGYDPATIKVVAYTAAALFASIAGALFAPIIGFITPAQVGVVPSSGPIAVMGQPWASSIRPCQGAPRLATSSS